MSKSEKLGPYLLGGIIGKGGFGSVYKAINTNDGTTVAIKKVKIGNMEKGKQSAIMVEIELLKKLRHPNIVKYISCLSKDGFLFIVLEYMENGSLQSICKKFGQIPEHLTAVYICQVLEGLHFLHEQGVIHRDIKGANILTTKDGQVKLADFGVATKLADNEEIAVVGTPYWMAPEIIEMSGPSTASDIWSVGSTVIELISGDPPYFEFDPLPAMFRIVQDDHPPLPEGISGALRDFLLQCFQKDPNLRVSAKKLIKHSWIQAVKKNQQEQSRQANATEDKWDKALTTIKNFNTSLRDGSPAIVRSPSSASTSAAAAAAEARRKAKVRRERSIGKVDAFLITSAATASTSSPTVPTIAEASADKKERLVPRALPRALSGAVGSGRSGSSPATPDVKSPEEEQNWLGAARSMFDSASDMTAQVLAEKARLGKERPVSAASAKAAAVAAASAAGNQTPSSGPSSGRFFGGDGQGASNSIGSINSLTYSNSPTIVALASSVKDKKGDAASPLPHEERWDDDFEGDINISTVKPAGVKVSLKSQGKKADTPAPSATPPMTPSSATPGAKKDDIVVPAEAERTVTVRKPAQKQAAPAKGNMVEDWDEDFPEFSGISGSSKPAAKSRPAAPAPAKPQTASSKAGKAESKKLASDQADDTDESDDQPQTIVKLSAAQQDALKQPGSQQPQQHEHVTNAPAPSRLLQTQPLSSALAKYRDSDDSFNDLDVDDSALAKLRSSGSADRKVRLISPEMLQYYKDAASAVTDSVSLERFTEKDDDNDFSDLGVGANKKGPESSRPQETAKAQAAAKPKEPVPAASAATKVPGHTRTASGSHGKLVSKSSGGVKSAGGSGGINTPGNSSSLKGRPASNSSLQRPLSSSSLGNTPPPESFSEDAFDGIDGEGLDGGVDLPLKLRSRRAMDSWNVSAEESDDSEDDPFADLEDEFEEYNEEERIIRDKQARISAEIMGLISGFRVGSSESEILTACEKLIVLFNEDPEQKYALISNHGVLPILEMLEVSDKLSVIHSVLRIINTIVEENDEMQENLCLIGGLPAIMKYADHSYSVEVRTEALSFIREVCYTSTVTLQMFIACRGLPVLVDCLETDYSKFRPLVLTALEIILSIFELESSTPKNDFARIFTKYGLLKRLQTTLANVLKDKRDPNCRVYIDMIATLYLIFSHADTYVKSQMAQVDSLKELLVLLDEMSPDVVVKFLKSIKNLTWEPTVLSSLMSAGVISKLVKILETRDGPYVTDMHNHTLNSLFNFCRISRERQEHAAVSGIIPSLKYFISIANSPLRQVALQIICDIAHASKRARSILWEQGGVAVFLDLLRDPYWQVNALEALAVWLLDDGSHVESVLAQPESVAKIVRAVSMAKSPSFDNMLEPLQKLTFPESASSDKLLLNRALSSSKLVSVLAGRFQHPKANVRVNLLKVISNLYHGHTDKPKMVSEFSLYPVVRDLCKDSAILVQEMAKKLLDLFEHPDPESLSKKVSSPHSETQV